MSTSPFDHQRDAELGKILRRALSSSDDDAFAARVIARLEEVEGARASSGEWWEVLGRWARPGLAAAVLGIVTASAVWLSGARTPASAEIILENPLVPASEAFVTSALLTTTQPPALDAVLGMALESPLER